MLLLVALLLGMASAGTVTLCTASVGTIVNAIGGGVVVNCAVTRNCPNQCVVNAIYNCTDSAGNGNYGNYQCISNTGGNPVWARSSNGCQAAQVCNSQFGTVVRYLNSTTTVELNAARISECSVTQNCPPFDCCRQSTSGGNVIKCGPDENNYPLYGCMAPSESPLFRQLCNSYCGSDVGTIAGGAACSAGSNCPAAGCCDTPASQGRVISCLAGNGQTLTFNCTTPGTTPVYTPNPPVLNCPTGSATNGASYSQTLTASGGSGGYTFTKVSGLPWASVTGGTLLSGTATSTGSPFSFVLRVTDSAGAFSEKTCQIIVYAPPSLSCVTPLALNLQKLQVGVSSTGGVVVTASGGAGGPWTFSYLSNPGSIGTLSASGNNGVIGAFTPATSSSGAGFATQIQVRDVGGGVATATCTLPVAPAPTVNCPQFGGSTWTRAYVGIDAAGSITLSSNVGSFTPATYTLTPPAGGNPTTFYGLSGSAFTGSVSGLSGTSIFNATFSVRVTDSNGGTATKTCWVQIVPAVTVQCPGGKDLLYWPTNSAFSGNAILTGGEGGYAISLENITSSNGGTVTSTGLQVNMAAQSTTTLITYSIRGTSGNALPGRKTCQIQTIPPVSAQCPTGGVFPPAEQGQTITGVSVGVPSAFATFSITGLPPSLTYSTTTGAISGSISRTATVTTYQVAVNVSSPIAFSVVTCPWAISAKPSLTCPAQRSLTTGQSYAGILTRANGIGNSASTRLNPATAGWSVSLSGQDVSIVNAAPSTTVTLTIYVTDSVGVESDGVICTFTVQAAPTIACGTPLTAVLFTQAIRSASMPAPNSAKANSWVVQPLNASGVFVYPPSISGSGALNFTVNTIGRFVFNVSAVDTFNNRGAWALCTYVVTSLPAISACPAYPNGCIGAAYNSGTGFTVTNVGAGGGTFSAPLLSNTGLSINPTTGVISGTILARLAQGVVNFDVIFTDSAGGTATRTCNINIWRLVLVCPTTPTLTQLNGYIGIEIDAVMTVNGGTGTGRVFTLVSGPAWMGINSSTGRLTGKPTATGQFNYNVNVTDSSGCSTAITCTVFVYAGLGYTCLDRQYLVSPSWTPNITISPLGQPPFTFAANLTTITAPSNGWFQLSANSTQGQLRFMFNTTANVGSYRYCITVTDGSSNQISVCCLINVYGPLGPLTCPPNGTTCSAINSDLLPNGGSGGYTFIQNPVSGTNINVFGTTSFVRNTTFVTSPTSTTLITYTVSDSMGSSRQQQCWFRWIGPTVACPTGVVAIAGRDVAYSYQIVLPAGCTASTCNCSAIAGTTTTLGVSSGCLISGNITGVAGTTVQTLSVPIRFFSSVAPNAGCFYTTCSIKLSYPTVAACPVTTFEVTRNSSASLLLSQLTFQSSPVTSNVTITFPPSGLSKFYTFSGTGAAPTLVLTGAETFNNLVDGTNTYIIRVQDQLGYDKSVTCSLIASSPIGLTCGSYGGLAYLTVAVNSALNGGGSPPLVYTNTSALPAGLRLNSTTGAITGTPTSATSVTTSFSVSDGTVSATATCTLNVQAAPQPQCASGITSLVIGQAVNVRVVSCASGTCSSYSNTSALPGGLTLTAAGFLTGTPTGPAGDFFTTFRTVDAGTGAVGNTPGSCLFRVSGTYTLSCFPTVRVAVGQAFSASSTISGSPSGSPTVTYTFNPALPPGVTGLTYGGLQISGSAGWSGVAPGDYLVTLNATDAAGTISSVSGCQLSVYSAVVLSCPAPETLGSGVTFTKTFAASGGVQTGGSTTYTYTRAIVQNPTVAWSSFAITTGGVLTGTPAISPSTWGNTTYRVTATEAVTGATAQTGVCWVFINQGLTLNCPTNTLFSVGRPYSQTLSASGGGSGPKTFALVSSPAGGGFTLTGAQLNGQFNTLPNPTSGTYNATVSDGVTTVWRLCNYNVSAVPVLRCPAPITSQSGRPVNTNFTIDAGTGLAPFTISVTNTLPPGVGSTNGVLSGTLGAVPSPFTVYTYNGSVVDAAGGQATVVGCTMNISSLPQVFCPLGAAGVGQSYNSFVTVVGGTGPYTFGVQSSLLPPVLSVSGNNIYGGASVAGLFTFMVNVTDSFGAFSSRLCTIEVTAFDCPSRGRNTTLNTTASICTSCNQCRRLANPCFNKQCQLNVVLLLDQSNSIRVNQLTIDNVKDGVRAFLTGMQSIVSVGGTVNLGVITFDSSAVRTRPLTAYNDAYHNDLLGYIQNEYLVTGGFTNWAQAFFEAGKPWEQTVDIFVIFTDGQPETQNPGPWICDDSCYSETSPAGLTFFADICVASPCAGQPPGLTFKPGFEQRSNLWAACTAADALKQSGAKLFLVGVGDVTQNEDEIQVVTGTIPWSGAADTFFSSDYIISSNYSQLANLFTGVGVGLCPCLASYPPCIPLSGTGSCQARTFSARVQVSTTDQTISTVFPKFSTTSAYIYYQFSGGASSRVAFDFFQSGQSAQNTTNPVVGRRTDVLNPCKLQRLVTCGSGCYNIQEKQNLPRFFVEVNDTLGTTGSRLYSTRPYRDCIGYTKVYLLENGFTTNVRLTSPEAIAFVWAKNDFARTPCAAESYDGTFYEFFSDVNTTGVVQIGLPPKVLPAATTAFNFVSQATCQVPACVNDAEIVFVIDEQFLIADADYKAIRSYVAALISNSSANSTFGLYFTNTSCANGTFSRFCYTDGITQLVNKASALAVLNVHQQNRGTSNYFYSVAEAVRAYWPSATSSTNFPRQLVTFVAGPNTGSAADFQAMMTELTAKNVEYWSVGVNVGASNATLLQQLASSNQYLHYQTVASGAQLNTGSTRADLSLRLCPAGNLCGSNCKGFCSCAGATSCECPTCTPSLCAANTCVDSTKSCFWNPNPIDNSDRCFNAGCDNITGPYRYPAVNCSDNNLCTRDICVGGVCQFPPVAACDPLNNDPCYTASCDPLTGFCNNTIPLPYSSYSQGANACVIKECIPGTGGVRTRNVTCDDFSECTRNLCDPVTGCYYPPITCSDGDLCTFDSCNATVLGGCVYTFNGTCNDGDACTIDSCNGTIGCVNKPRDCAAEGNNDCFTYTCDRVNGCLATPVVCEDGNPCHNYTCFPVGGCRYTNITCNDGDRCTSDICQALSPTQYQCLNPSNGQCDACGNTALACNPPANPNACQETVCVDQLTSSNNVSTCLDPRVPDRVTCEFNIQFGNPPKYCYAVDKPANFCDDSNACTDDSCNITTGCVHTPVTCFTDLCHVDTCNPAIGCQSAVKTCDDGYKCTIDTCNATTGCVFTPLQCNNGTNCTTNYCNNNTGQCVYTDITPTCRDTSECTIDTCDPNVLGGCVFTPVVCNDNNVCTTDTCDPSFGCRYNLTLDCEDGNPCTQNSCDPISGCQSVDKPCNPVTSCRSFVCNTTTGVCDTIFRQCTDYNFCTFDSCVEPDGCLFTPRVCPPPNKCEIWGCLNVTGGQCNKTADVICDDNNTCTENSCDVDKGCTFKPIACPPGANECLYAYDCVGTGPEPVCLYQNISQLIDFCGVCLGDNFDCFFTSVIGAGQISAITGGAVAGIVIACVIAALIAAWFSKKGYDSWKAHSDMGAFNTNTNPYYVGNGLAGDVPGA